MKVIIYIKWLSKCGIIKGSYFLDKISILVTKLRKIGKIIEYIKLIDISNKQICNIPICLTTIKILTTGKSWYNKFGYKSKKYENEVKVNEIIIKKKYKDFIVDLKKKLNKKNELEYDKIANDNVVPNIDDNTTVQEYFNSIWKEIIYNSKKENCENEKFINQLIWLEKFISIIKSSKILTYEYYLQKQIKPENEYTVSKWLKYFMSIFTYPTILEKNIKLEPNNLYTATKYLKKEYYEKYIKYKNKYLNLKNQLGKI